ncbi:hypothetical protein D7X88_15425 [bacterium C-53]|nr:hypothetical protein [Lachnospiraceae bacterium]NBI04356.1 hypothetical protein [Lachnospiraceae bacterium]RKJ08257.1 hypothetical protein D7X88_15425 [bacterium C-53]
MKQYRQAYTVTNEMIRNTQRLTAVLWESLPYAAVPVSMYRLCAAFLSGEWRKTLDLFWNLNCKPSFPSKGESPVQTE